MDEPLDTVDPLVAVPLLWLLEAVLLVYDPALSKEPLAGADGFRYVAVLLDDEEACSLLLATVLLPAVTLLSLLVALLRETELLPTVPRLVLELMPEPLLKAVRPLSANTRVSPSVSYLGTYERLVEMCPPWPIPGPPWNP